MRTSCIRLRAKSRIAVLYEDFLEILGGNMLAAMLLAILVYWTDVKIGKKDENLWVWKSQEDFQEDLLFDKPGMKPPHRTTISSALDLLKRKGFIQWRKNPALALDRTRQYLINQEKIQAAIDALPATVSRKSDIPMSENRLTAEQAIEASSGDLSNVGKPTMQSRKSNIALSEFQQSIVGKPTSNTSDYITEITESVITEERERVFASAPTPPAEMPSEEDFHFYGTEHQHLLWNCRNWCAVNHATCEDYVAAIEDGLHERTTDKMPAVPPNVTPVSHSQSSIPDGYMQGEDDGQLTPIEQTVSGLSPGAAAARHSGQVARGAASTAPPRSGPRASGKRNGKAHAAPPVPIPIEAVSILDDWDSLFKAPIPRTEKHVQAAVDLVPCHPSQEDLKGCKGWLFTTDNPQKPWFRKKGVTLQDVRDNYGAWQSVQPTEPTEDELEPYSIPWFLAQQARRQAQELQA